MGGDRAAVHHHNTVHGEETPFDLGYRGFRCGSAALLKHIHHPYLEGLMFADIFIALRVFC